MAPHTSPLEMFEACGPNVAWAPFFLVEVEQQRREHDVAKAIELARSSAAGVCCPGPFSELDDLDRELIHEAAREMENAISLAHEREIDDQLAQMGPSVLELAVPTKENSDMAYIPDFGAYDSNAVVPEETLDRGARNRATYGYDPDEYDVPAEERPMVVGGEVERMDFMDQVHKENPLLNLANAKHRHGDESGDAPRAPRVVYGRVNADGDAVFEEDGSPIYDRYGQTISVVDKSAEAERAAKAGRSKVDAMQPDAFRDVWAKQFRGAFKR